jgi:hypothetical protein
MVGCQRIRAPRTRSSVRRSRSSGRVERLTARPDMMEAENAQLRAENAELKRLLGMNSRNSAKLPSTDSPFAKPALRSLRRRSGRKRVGTRDIRLDAAVGRRSGRDGVPRADRVRRRRRGAPQAGMERRQVFDLSPMRVRVTEHRLITRRCGCGTTTTSDAPDGVRAPVSYRPRITAIILSLAWDSSCPSSAQPRRWPSCSAPRSRMAPSRRCPNAPQAGSMSSARPCVRLSPHRRSPGSTRPGCGSRAAPIGCTALAPTTTP